MMTDPIALSALESLTLFRELTPAQLGAAHAVLRELELPADYPLIGEGDEDDGWVYIIASGSLKVSVSDGERQIILGLRGRGEVLGEMSALDSQQRSATVVTLEPTTLLCVSRADFWNVLWEMPPVAYALTCLLAQRVRLLTAQLRVMATLDVPGRLARQLVLLADELGAPNGAPLAPVAASADAAEVEIPIHLTQGELAELIGATREQVNKLLRNWTRQGWIRTRDKRLILRQRGKLEALYLSRVPATQAGTT